MFKKMFVNLDNGETVIRQNIIGVFDIDEATMSEDTKKCLKTAQEEMRVVNIANDLPKSIVLVAEPYMDRVFLSGLSSEIILKRINENSALN